MDHRPKPARTEVEQHVAAEFRQKIYIYLLYMQQSHKTGTKGREKPKVLMPKVFKNKTKQVFVLARGRRVCHNTCVAQCLGLKLTAQSDDQEEVIGLIFLSSIFTHPAILLFFLFKLN